MLSPFTYILCLLFRQTGFSVSVSPRFKVPGLVSEGYRRREGRFLSQNREVVQVT